jgi:NAD(P)-dependent dehydrogenase (short-subunit alcohol dehydrogenase family)
MTSVAVTSGLENKRILVTGAARGLGRALVEHLVASGANVAAADIDTVGLKTWSDGIEGVASFAVDVASEDSVTELIDGAMRALGGLDGVVNNAGRVAVTRAAAADISLREFDEVMAVNARGPWLIYRAAHDALADGGGSVVNISSETAFTGSQNLSHYVTTKAAVVGLTKALCNEGGQDGIRVNAIAPGFLDTPGGRAIGDPDTYDVSGTPLARVGLPEDVVGAIAFLLSDASSFVSGQVLLVNGGRTCH